MSGSKQRQGFKQLMLFSDTPSLDDILHGDDYVKLRVDAEKLQERLKNNDTEGAVTSARSLLETCCKHILEKLSISYSNGDDLKQLHKKTANALDLHPDQHAEDQLKQMMRGCNGIVNSLAALRNSHSDAHGKRPGHIPLDHSQAEYAAYMSCGLTRFLVQTFEQQVNRKRHTDLTKDEKEKLLSIWWKVANENGVTDPDQIIFKPALEEIAIRFTNSSNIFLSREDIHKFLANARKKGKLRPDQRQTQTDNRESEEE
jgi:Abortive infection C-terminus